MEKGQRLDIKLEIITIIKHSPCKYMCPTFKGNYQLQYHYLNKKELLVYFQYAATAVTATQLYVHVSLQAWYLKTGRHMKKKIPLVVGESFYDIGQKHIVHLMHIHYYYTFVGYRRVIGCT